MNQEMIAACLWTFAVLFATFIIILERVLNKKEEENKKKRGK